MLRAQPGLEPARLQVVGDSLVLKGERKPLPSGEVLCFHRIERPEGQFHRVFRLPDEVDAGGIDAVFREGLLRVSLPKSSPGGLKPVNDL